MKLENADEHISLVARGYDTISDAYFDNYRGDIPGEVSELVNRFDGILVNRSKLLELGCGNGLPFTAQLANRHIVTGIDVSPVQIDQARNNVPSAEFTVADMTRLELPANSFDAVLALYSIIHVPRERHQGLFESIYSWLKPGGAFMASLGSSDSEEWIDNNWLGAPMYWSHFDPEKSRELLKNSGFEIEEERIEELINPADGETERHYWVTTRKPISD